MINEYRRWTNLLSKFAIYELIGFKLSDFSVKFQVNKNFVGKRENAGH